MRYIIITLFIDITINNVISYRTRTLKFVSTTKAILFDMTTFLIGKYRLLENIDNYKIFIILKYQVLVSIQEYQWYKIWYTSPGKSCVKKNNGLPYWSDEQFILL